MKNFQLLLCPLLLFCSPLFVTGQVAETAKQANDASKVQQKRTELKSADAKEKSTEERLKEAGASVEVYKNTTDSKGDPVELKMFIFNPPNHQTGDEAPAIVFFFGGGWNGGSPAQFTQQCKYLAERGMVAMTADYRVFSRQGTRATACVSDGKSAVRWIRENSERLGIDPNKVAAGGGSAGGHVAACTGVIKTLDEPAENSQVSSKPNALVLFNPALVLAPIDGAQKADRRLEKKLADLKKRIGADPKTVSPAHNVSKGDPQTIIFHGKADKTVPYATAEVFTKLMQDAGNTCELVGYPKQGHGFFNAKRKNGKYAETVKEMDRFLVDLDFLDAKKE